MNNSNKRTIKFLELSQVKQLLSSLSRKNFTQERDYQIIKLILNTGLRVGEAVNLSEDSINYDRDVLKINGKGGVYREVPLNSESKEALKRLREINGRSVIHALLINKKGSKISRRYIERMIKSCSLKHLGISGVITPHGLRHTFATMLSIQGERLEVIQRLMGHKSIITTVIYLHVSNKETAEAVRRLCL